MPGRFLPQVWLADPAAYAPPRYRRACKYEAFLPDPLAGADVTLRTPAATVVSDAERALAEVNGTAAQSPVFAPLARLLLRTESIASSKIEGLHVDARALSWAEAAADTGGGAGPQAREVLANVDAMQLAIEQATEAPLTVGAICDIHRELMRDTPGARPGNVREKQNWIGGNDYNPCGASYVPPPPEHVGPLLEDLCEFVGSDEVAPLLQAAVAHAQFELIHPFADGNGRTGRALIHVVLRSRGLSNYVPPISVILGVRREQYIAGLTDFREGRLDEWLELFGSAAATSAALARRCHDALVELQARWRAAAGHIRRQSAVWPLIDALPASPVLTVASAVAATSRSRPAVAAAIEELASLEIVRPLGSGKRNRAWEVPDVLDLVAEMEEDVR